MAIILHDSPRRTQAEAPLTWRYALHVAGETILVAGVGYVWLCLLLLF